MGAAKTFVARVKTGNLLPEGTLAVGIGLLVLGVASYVGFVVTGHGLTPERYATWAVLWSLIFVAVPGVFFPLEQEISRALGARRALGVGGGPLVRRAVLLAVGLAALIMLISLASSGFLLDQLFDDDRVLLAALVFSIPVYALSHSSRGTLAGNGR